MKTINRSVAVIRPREPYIQWALSVDQKALHLEETLRSQVSVYLVPPDPREAQQTAHLSRWFADVFENELESWFSATSTWPDHMNFDLFQEWFEVDTNSMVTDLVNGPLCHDEW